MRVDDKSQVEGVEEFVLSLSTRQREMFVDVFCHAEGNRRGDTWNVVQKDGSKLHGFILAAQLCGYRPSVTLHENGKDCYNVLLSSKQDVGTNTAKMVPTEVAPVWCVTTDLGSWTMRQGRNVAVTGNTSFGRGAKAIAVSLGISIEEAQSLMDAYVRPGSAFAEWRNEIDARAISSDPQAGRLENKFGRKFQAELVTHKNKFNIIRSALSFMSQSTANDICLTAALEVHKKLPDNARIMGTIHDAIYVTCNHEDAKWIGLMLQEEMEKAGKSVYGDQVAFVAEPDMGTNLANGVEFDKITW